MLQRDDKGVPEVDAVRDPLEEFLKSALPLKSGGAYIRVHDAFVLGLHGIFGFAWYLGIACYFWVCMVFGGLAWYLGVCPVVGVLHCNLCFFMGLSSSWGFVQ